MAVKRNDRGQRMKSRAHGDVGGMLKGMASAAVGACCSVSRVRRLEHGDVRGHHTQTGAARATRVPSGSREAVCNGSSRAAIRDMRDK